MYNFLKSSDAEEFIEDGKEKKKQEDSSPDIGAGYAATQTAQIKTQQAAQKFAKPDTYTGNRTLYDSGSAKINAKKNLFKSGGDVVDPYTGDKLVLTKQEAKRLYGDDWSKHLAESDHIRPLEQIYEETKNDPWLTVDDIKSGANRDDNIRVISRKLNNAKRSRTNKELVENEEYLKSKEVRISEEGKKHAVQDHELSRQSMNNQYSNSRIKNVTETGHEAGKVGAQSAGITAVIMSGSMNIISVIKGEKSVEEAIIDTVKDGGEAAVAGYAMSGGLTVVSHSLSYSSSKFIQGLVKSNVPGKVITAVMATGSILKRWGEGEITIQECLTELGDKGLNMATVGYSMAVGQSLIPVPIVGAAIGALVGSLVTSKYYNYLMGSLKSKEIEHQERLRRIAECERVAAEARAFRDELEIYLNEYFQEYQDCFDEAISEIRFSLQEGDADGAIAGANQITRKLGGNVYYETTAEFKEFLANDSIDIL